MDTLTNSQVSVCLSVSHYQYVKIDKGWGRGEGEGRIRQLDANRFHNIQDELGNFLQFLPLPPPPPSFLCPIVSGRPTQDCFLDILFRHLKRHFGELGTVTLIMKNRTLLYPHHHFCFCPAYYPGPTAFPESIVFEERISSCWTCHTDKKEKKTFPYI